MAALLGAITVVGIDRMFVALGQGSANVDFEFKVVDAVTGKPIRGAVIVFDGSDDRWLPPEELVTDAVGSAHHQIEDMQIASRQGMLGILNERTAHFPLWQFQVSAPSHIQSGPLPTPTQRRLHVISREGQWARASLRIELKPTESADRNVSSADN